MTVVILPMCEKSIPVGKTCVLPPDHSGECRPVGPPPQTWRPCVIAFGLDRATLVTSFEDAEKILARGATLGYVESLFRMDPSVSVWLVPHPDGLPLKGAVQVVEMPGEEL